MDTNFDPDAYLAGKGHGGFDPDSYLSQKQPEQSNLESAARGALRNFPLAQQAAAAIAPINPFSEEKEYGPELKHLTEAAEEGKRQNPWSYGTGAVTGSLAPLALGPVGAGLSRAPILGNALLGGAQAISDVNIEQDPNEAVKQGLTGGVIGGATAGVLGKILPGGKVPGIPAAAEAAAIPAVEAVPQAIRAAEAPVVAGTAPAAVKTATEMGGRHIPGNMVSPEFTPSAERIYASNIAQGLGGTPRQLMKVFGKNDPVKTLNQIGGWLETAGAKGESLSGYLDQPGELLAKVTALNKSSGKEIGDVVSKIDLEGGLVSKADIWEGLNDLAMKSADPMTAGRIDRMIATVERAEKNGLNDFETLQQLKKMAGKQIAKDPEMSEVYGYLADKANAAVDAYGEQIKDKALRVAYEKAKLNYHNSSRILPILRYAEAKNIVGGPAGHHTLRSLLGTIYEMAADIMGVPTGGQLGKNISLKAAPAMRNVIQTGEKAVAPIKAAAAKLPANAKGRHGFNQAAQSELTDYLESQYNRQKK